MQGNNMQGKEIPAAAGVQTAVSN
uniref:Uncharacterized protein n=1 Tax=Arundo donax TaxID=35708 RepID=A0A0A9AB52_ARUDO